MAEQTDNHNPQAKLTLRRYLVNKYHASGPSDVMDCCQGSGLLWGVLRKEFPIDSYWGMDLKPKPGRLKLDSSRVLDQSGWTQNIIDIDTYGAPWKHWQALLRNISQPTTVFMTIGQKVTGTVGKMSKGAIGAIGLGPLYAKLPPAFHVKLSARCVNYLLAMPYDNDIMIIEAVEIESGSPNVRYVGVRLDPQKTSGCEADTSNRPKRKQPNQEVTHV